MRAPVLMFMTDMLSRIDLLENAQSRSNVLDIRINKIGKLCLMQYNASRLPYCCFRRGLENTNRVVKTYELDPLDQTVSIQRSIKIVTYYIFVLWTDRLIIVKSVASGKQLPCVNPHVHLCSTYTFRMSIIED